MTAWLAGTTFLTAYSYVNQLWTPIICATHIGREIIVQILQNKAAIKLTLLLYILFPLILLEATLRLMHGQHEVWVCDLPQTRLHRCLIRAIMVP